MSIAAVMKLRDLDEVIGSRLGPHQEAIRHSAEKITAAMDALSAHLHQYPHPPKEAFGFRERYLGGRLGGNKVLAQKYAEYRAWNKEALRLEKELDRIIGSDFGAMHDGFNLLYAESMRVEDDLESFHLPGRNRVRAVCTEACDAVVGIEGRLGKAKQEAYARLLAVKTMYATSPT